MTTKEEVFADKSTGGGKTKRELNAKIWGLRRDTDLSQREIAGRLHITEVTVSKHLNQYKDMALMERVRKRGW